MADKTIFDLTEVTSAGTSDILWLGVSGVDKKIKKSNLLKNLDADTLDTYHASTTPTASYIPVANASNKLDNGWLKASATPTANYIPVANASNKIDNGWLKTGSGNGIDADKLDGFHASSFTKTAINFIIPDEGAAISTGIKGKAGFRVPFACTITGWYLTADASGSLVIDIWKDTYANFPPTSGDTITASAKPTLSSAIKAYSTTLTGWTTSIAEGDYLIINVVSCTTCKEASLSLMVTRT